MPHIPKKLVISKNGVHVDSDEFPFYITAQVDGGIVDMGPVHHNGKPISPPMHRVQVTFYVDEVADERAPEYPTERVDYVSHVLGASDGEVS